ncbi:MAG: hypothetical protein R2762_01675 [Bryobacteraceae bacterium]
MPFARRLALTVVPILSLFPVGFAAEAAARFEMPVTISGGFFQSPQSAAAPRFDSAATVGARMVAYPTFRISRHWSGFAALQVHTRPYFHEQLSTQGYGVRGDVLQAYLNYSRTANGRAVSFKAGQLLSAFGSFLLRYDDRMNPLVDMPLMYGYYYRPVSTLGMMGAQVDVSAGPFDARAQFTNSSPANRRSILDTEQYGGWTGGAGVTLATGIRAGASIYRGAYLHREHRFFRPGEASPKGLPATGYGLDVQAARGHWSFHGELQRHLRAYRAIPTLTIDTGYAEARFAIDPRWYAATRTGIQRGTLGYIPSRTVQEFAVGYRAGRNHILKISYELVRGGFIYGNQANVFAIQWVAWFEGPQL